MAGTVQDWIFERVCETVEEHFRTGRPFRPRDVERVGFQCAPMRYYDPPLVQKALRRLAAAGLILRVPPFAGIGGAWYEAR